MSLGWPADAVDVRNLYWLAALRAGHFDDAMGYQTLALPGAMRDADGAATVRVAARGVEVPRATREGAAGARWSERQIARRRDDLVRHADVLHELVRDAGRSRPRVLPRARVAAAVGGQRAFRHSAQCRVLVAGDERVPRGSAFRFAGDALGTHRLVAKVRRARSIASCARNFVCGVQAGG